MLLEVIALLGEAVIPCPVLIINFKKEKQMLSSFFNWIIKDIFCGTFWFLRLLRNCKIWCTPDTRGISSFKRLLPNSASYCFAHILASLLLTSFFFGAVFVHAFSTVSWDFWSVFAGCIESESAALLAYHL